MKYWDEIRALRRKGEAMRRELGDIYCEIYKLQIEYKKVHQCKPEDLIFKSGMCFIFKDRYRVNECYKCGKIHKIE